MRIRFNPFASGKEEARRSMAASYPNIFILATDEAISNAGKKKRAACEVFMTPDEPAAFTDDKKRMEYELKLQGNRSIFLTLAVIAVNFLLGSGPKNTGKLAWGAITFALLCPVYYSGLKEIVRVSETKKLLKKGIDAINRFPNGPQIIEINSNLATSSGKRQ